MQNIVYIFLGGGIGASLRYLITVAAYRFLGSAFPYGTLFINIVGSVFLGFVVGIALHKSDVVNTQMKLFLTVGIAGGFTTFSTFSYESLELLRNGQFGLGFAYLLGSPILGLLGVYISSFLLKYVI